jgi:hypothetical protein
LIRSIFGTPKISGDVRIQPAFRDIRGSSESGCAGRGRQSHHKEGLKTENAGDDNARKYATKGNDGKTPHRKPPNYFF